MFLKVVLLRHEYILKVYIKSQQNFNSKSQYKESQFTSDTAAHQVLPSTPP